MFKSIFTNSFGILFSRILGFIRDLLSASFLGANIYSDIFFVAFKLPNLFRRIFAEGAFTQSFLPAYSSASYKPKFAFLILQKFFIILLILSLFITLFSGFVTEILAFGFSDEAKEIASPLVAINFYYLIFIFLVTFLASLLQYKNHFATTAFSTGLLNIAIIISLFLSMDKEPIEIIYYMSYGVLAGGLLQLIAHIIVAKKYKILKLLIIGCKDKKHTPEKGNKKFEKAFIPSIFGNSTAHISAFLDTWLASFLVAGSISYLYYSNRIFQLPLALFAIASSIAIFPKISKYLNNNEEEKAFEFLTKGFWFLLITLTISTIIGIIFAKEMVWLLFERGEFGRDDTINTALVLSMYMIGLLPFGIVKIFSSHLYATHKHLKAAKFSAISLGFNIIFSLVLIYPLGAMGLALASSLSAFILLFLTLKEFGFYNFKKMFNKKYFLLFLISSFLVLGISIIIKYNLVLIT
jgi:putative peptidoglycan lipid II flippase